MQNPIPLSAILTNVSGVVTSASSATNAKTNHILCCSPACLRNFNALHINYSLPNLKLRSFSPCPSILEDDLTVGKAIIKNSSTNGRRSVKVCSPDLPRSLAADEELWRYFAMNSVDKCKCEAFACRHTDHIKEDLILLAEEGKFGDEPFASPDPDSKISGESGYADDDVGGGGDSVRLIRCRLIDPVALTLDEMQYFVPILS